MRPEVAGGLDRTERPAGRRRKGAVGPSMARRPRRAAGLCAALLALCAAAMSGAEPSSAGDRAGTPQADGAGSRAGGPVDAVGEGESGGGVVGAPAPTQPVARSDDAAGSGPPDGDAHHPASRGERRCVSEELGTPPFVQEFLKLKETTGKLRHLRTWQSSNKLELAERNCLSELNAYHFESLFEVSVLHHAPGNDLDCLALADELDWDVRHHPDSWDMTRNNYFAAYRMFDVVVQDLCPGAPTISCRGMGCPPHLKEGDPSAEVP